MDSSPDRSCEKPARTDRLPVTAMAGWGQDPAHCVERLTELAGLGVTRFIVVGPSGVDPDVARANRPEHF